MPSPADDLLDRHDALGLARLVRDKAVSPGELLDQAIARAEAGDARFNFMAQKLYDFGRKAIADGLPDGPFRGVPLLLKDLHTNIAGERTGQGSRFYADYRPDFTSELVRRHQAAGFVIFGKTTTPEFGLTATTESLACGQTRNPWNPARIAGGSSGGSAAAVAAGVVPIAHASDGGGSIRIPASCCGLFGLKPSRGRVPMGPARTEGWGGLSTQHAISRSVRDSAAMLDATHGIEVGSRYGAPTPEGSFLSQVGRDPGKLRVALMLQTPAGTPVDPECVAAARAAAKLLESLGHHIEEAAPKVDVAALGTANFAAISTALAVDVEDRAKLTGIAPSPDVLEKVTLTFLEYSKQFRGIDVARANNVFQETAIAIARFMVDFDIILSPTVAAPPIELGRLGLMPDDFATWGRDIAAFTPWTGLSNATGQPSMSLPLAMSKDGLPIGVMMTGRYGDEATLLRLAGQVERAAPWFDRRPA
ncbi:amidase [Sphingopyxis lindanitolerans]|uniref:Amidase n=2 Tax=Sphingopyxis lindanitolerans TaxID=2054227 RepID=A0A2S8B9X7_9SPHN|nr:amidase [Sphingopyxis lindanitolerans]